MKFFLQLFKFTDIIKITVFVTFIPKGKRKNYKTKYAQARRL